MTWASLKWPSCTHLPVGNEEDKLTDCLHGALRNFTIGEAYAVVRKSLKPLLQLQAKTRELDALFNTSEIFHSCCGMT